MGRVQSGLGGPFKHLSGVPVVTMANDTWASVLGLGAMQAGAGYNLSGTTEVLGIMSPTAAQAEGLLTVDWSGLTQIGGPSQTGGDTLVWLQTLLGHRDGDPRLSGAELNRLLAGERDASPLLFLPYLRGERVPYWDPSLRGAWVGLNRHHGPADLAWSVLEGIAFLNRIVLERAEQAAGQRVGEIRFGGGGAANAVWCQIKADVLNRPIAVTGDGQHGLLGAALAAWVALGRFPSLEAAQAALIRVATRYEPAAARRTHYDRLFDVFKDAQRALAPISARLAGFHTHGAIGGSA